MNKEAKVRRSTKSELLGKAKVMNYEDLQEARAKRAEKEKEKAAQDKAIRGRKRKTSAQEGAPEPKTDEAGLSEATPARTPTAQIRKTPVPWKAPVAQMIPRDYTVGA